MEKRIEKSAAESADTGGEAGRRVTAGMGSARPTQDDLAALGDEIAQLAGQIAAAEARFLRLLGEFDAWGGWGGPGIRSLAQWLSWRAGMSLRTAQEHIRMARALRRLPSISRAFEAGELSFSKVRALTRVATPMNEDSLARMAKNAPAAHVERVVAGLRKVPLPKPRPWDPQSGGAGPTRGEPGEEGVEGRDSGAEGEAPTPEEPEPGAQGSGEERPPTQEPDQQGARAQEPGHGAAAETRPGGSGQPSAEPGAVGEPRTAPSQRLRWRWDEETDELVVWGRFGGADGKVLLAALTRAELERIRTQQHEDGGRAEEGQQQDRGGRGEPVDPGGSSDAVDRTAPPPSDAGPALIALAQIGLAAQHAPAHAAAAEVIYLHVADDGGQASEVDGGRTGRVSADEGPVLDKDAGEEVLCGASARCVVQGAKGSVLAYGRRRRLFSATQLKALRLGDGCCQTPGCGRTRFLHAHHVVYWWHGGLTDLDNAVLLCSACHRAVHLGRLRITALGDQQFEFVDATSDDVIHPAPAVAGQADRILAQRTIGPRTVTGGWFGEPLDISAVTAELIAYWRQQDPASASVMTGGGSSDTWDDAFGDEVAWDDPRRGTWEVVTDRQVSAEPDEAA
ncbi:DUF222 domain-containing protein [Ornithinimicrobium sufpigmenti]|uniref:DUF222 domain-containing protein n=1 Tax=Ornithinimicrobium sufpigmenti TaxID=2508882 RepID=UPI001036619F|nr:MULTISPECIES: DUF222 domain-containing protein [unclassified Ornithinimicrobium]